MSTITLTRNLENGGWLATANGETHFFGDDTEAYRWLLTRPLTPAQRTQITLLCTAAENLGSRGYLWSP